MSLRVRCGTGALTLIQRFGSAANLNILCGASHKMFEIPLHLIIPHRRRSE